MICNIQLHSLSVIPTPRKYFRAQLSIWIRILCPTEGHWASARRRPWSWSKDWVRTRWRVCKLLRKQSSLSLRRSCFTFFSFLGFSLFQGERKTTAYCSTQWGGETRRRLMSSWSEVMSIGKMTKVQLIVQYPQGPPISIGRWRKRSRTWRRPC